MKPLKWIAIAFFGFLAFVYVVGLLNPSRTSRGNSDYLATREGPALERTIKRAIDMAGYQCASIRTTETNTAGATTIVGVDCGTDGVYVITETGDDIRVLKK